MTKMTSEFKAARKEAKRIALLPSIAHKVKVLDGIFAVKVLDCKVSSGNLEHFNNLLLQLGFKPVRTTKNLLNQNAGVLVIDADTPVCCDVGSETYWSM